MIKVPMKTPARRAPHRRTPVRTDEMTDADLLAHVRFHSGPSWQEEAMVAAIVVFFVVNFFFFGGV